MSGQQPMGRPPKNQNKLLLTHQVRLLAVRTKWLCWPRPALIVRSKHCITQQLTNSDSWWIGQASCKPVLRQTALGSYV